MDEENVVIGGFVLVGILAIVLVLGLAINVGEPELMSGLVVDMSHIPSTLRTNVSPVVVPNGQGGVGVGMAVSSSGSAEENFLIVQFPEQGYLKVDGRSIENMYNYEIGKTYTFCRYSTFLKVKRLKTCEVER